MARCDNLAALLFLLFGSLRVSAGNALPAIEEADAFAGCPPQQSWLNLAQRHASKVLALQPNVSAAMTIVGYRGAEPWRNRLVMEASDASTQGSNRLGTTWMRQPDRDYVNRTLAHGAGDLGAVARRRTASAQKEEILVPLATLLAGAALGLVGWQTLGIVAGYFGAQSGLSLYMKLVLTDAAIAPQLGLRGVPAAFLITAVQQLVAFLSVSLVFLTSWLVGGRLKPKRLAFKQCLSILCLSLAFAGNIGLNNFSLSLLAISSNLVIRSCLPLVTLAVHAVVGLFDPAAFPQVTWRETWLIAVGVACAGLVTLSELENSQDATESRHLLLGVLVCFISICSGSLDLVLGKILGREMGLSALDTTWFMSLPAAFALLPPSLLVHHPSGWSDLSLVTDWEVLTKVLQLCPAAVALVLLSGVFSVSYNVLRYAMVQHLSASHTAFAGNFNKALTIGLSLLLGLEPVPEGFWGHVMLLSIAGSISAFMVYSFLTTSQQKGLTTSQQKA